MSIEKLHALFSPDDGIHVIHAWSFADNSARADWNYDESTDVGKVAHMQDDGSFWLLAGFSEGPYWAKLTPQIASEIFSSSFIYGANDVGTQLDYIFANKAEALLSFNDQAGTAYTLQADDLGKEIRFSNNNPIALTIPSNATLALPDGFNFTVRQTSTGQVTGAVVTDTLRPAAGILPKTRGQWSVMRYVKQTPTTWTYDGDGAFI
jgi:hypothetical protein